MRRKTPRYETRAQDEVFSALANPTRRELLTLLRDGPQPVKALAARFELGRPAISEHLKVLRDAGLVVEEARGRERHYHLDAAPLVHMSRWLGPYEALWQEKLATVGHHRDEDPS